jgi:hypothetical protein
VFGNWHKGFPQGFAGFGKSIFGDAQKESSAAAFCSVGAKRLKVSLRCRNVTGEATWVRFNTLAKSA